MKKNFYNIIKGRFLVSDDALKNWRFIIFLSVLALVMIGSSHSADRKVHEIAALNNEVKELKSEYDNPEYAEVVTELTEQLAELRVQYKDSEDLDQKYIDIYVEKGWREDIVRKK